MSRPGGEILRGSVRFARVTSSGISRAWSMWYEKLLPLPFPNGPAPSPSPPFEPGPLLLLLL